MVLDRRRAALLLVASGLLLLALLAFVVPDVKETRACDAEAMADQGRDHWLGLLVNENLGYNQSDGTTWIAAACQPHDQPSLVIRVAGRHDVGDGEWIVAATGTADGTVGGNTTVPFSRDLPVATGTYVARSLWGHWALALAGCACLATSAGVVATTGRKAAAPAVASLAGVALALLAQFEVGGFGAVFGFGLLGVIPLFVGGLGFAFVRRRPVGGPVFLAILAFGGSYALAAILFVGSVPWASLA